METPLKLLTGIIMLMMSYKHYKVSGHSNEDREIHGHWLLDESDPDVRYFGKVKFKEGRCPGSKAPNFIKSDSYATVPNINISDCDFTIACWIRVPSKSGVTFDKSIIFWSNSASGNPLSLSLSNYVQIGGMAFVLSQMFRPLNYTNVITTKRIIPLNEWIHTAATCQGNKIRTYINGDYQSELHTQNISYPLTDDFSTDMSPEKFKSYYIRKDPRKEFSSSGKFLVMDLHVIGVALSSDEISDLFHDFPLVINQPDEVSGSTVEVTWEQPSCPVAMNVVYYIYYREVTRVGRSGWNTVNVSRGATHYNLQLECFKEYEIAVTNRKTSLPSKLWEVKTGTDFPLVINQPDEVSGSTVEVTWEPPSYPVAMNVVYYIYYREVTRAGRSGWNTVNVSRGVTHHNLQLECFKEYEIAVTNRKTSLPSKLWKVKTGTGQLSPPVINNKEKELNGCKVNISWSPPWNIKCPLTMYIIHYRKVPLLGSKADWIQINVTNVANTFYLIQLDCGTQYEIQMTVTNKRGESKKSNTWQVKTKSGIKDDQDTIVLRAEIIVGSVAVVAMVTVGIVCHRKKWKQKQLRAGLEKRSKSDIIPLLQWEVIPERVTFMEELGRGAFGKVHKGVLREFPSVEVFFKPREERVEVKKERVVAVKVLLEAAGEEGKKQFLQEIDFMKQIGFHRNVLSMLGYWVRSEPVLLILEYVPHGDLLHWLRKKRQEHVRYQTKSSNGEGTYQGVTKVVGESFQGVSSLALPMAEHDHVAYREEATPSEANQRLEENNTKCASSCNLENEHVKITIPSQDEQHNDEDELSAKDLLCLAWQIAQGMEYLTSKGFVHRDLAARNVLLGENRAVKIADFGLLRHTYDEIYEVKHTKKLPIKWTAPEALSNGLYTSKSDVWSFGVLLWELATMGGIPYPGVSNKQLYKLLKTGYRMDKPDMCSDEIYEIMLDCWREDPDKRPTFQKLILTLEEMMVKDTPYYDFNKLAANDACYDEVDSENSNTSNQDSRL